MPYVSSLIFLSATSSPVDLSFALYTTPYVPSPIFSIFWKLVSMGSIVVQYYLHWCSLFHNISATLCGPAKLYHVNAFMFSWKTTAWAQLCFRIFIEWTTPKHHYNLLAVSFGWNNVGKLTAQFTVVMW